MTTDKKNILQGCNEATRRRNPHLFGQAPSQAAFGVDGLPEVTPRPPKRIRQSSKPLLNKLEADFKMHLMHQVDPLRIRDQAVTLRLGNGVRYTPDFFAFHDGQLFAWEVKGQQQIQDDASAKLKIAAAQYPEIQFVLVWRTGGVWQEQTILP